MTLQVLLVEDDGGVRAHGRAAGPVAHVNCIAHRVHGRWRA